jgi:hypothetical protein
MKSTANTPLFQPGQIVTQKEDGHKALYLIPDRAYWIRQRPLWLHIPFYAKLSEDAFVNKKMNDTFRSRCLDCRYGQEGEPCFEYVLVCLDEMGKEFSDGRIDTHFCERTLRLAKQPRW